MCKALKFIFVFIFLILVFSIDVLSQDNDILIKLKRYEKEIIKLKEEYQLPSISVAILANQVIVYSKAFGYSDMENQTIATDSTPYRIASVTKPIASTIILRLVEEGDLDLDGNIKDYWKDHYGYFDDKKNWIEENAPQLISIIENYHYERDDITSKHHLTHTSEGTPGENFKYNGFLYSTLSKLVDMVSERDFYSLVKEDIILNLNMRNSLPQQTDKWRPDVLERLAKPYYKNEKGELVLGEYPPPNLGAGAGIISTVLDLAKFDIALDNDKLISSESKKLAFTPAKLNNGENIPYGLGWFVGKYKNHKVVYHTGWQTASFSALYLKVKDKDLTLILLANSEDLIAPFMQGLGAGQIEASPFAKEFLDLFL
jgi:CubicO group peptidase (beta-lactamase class C family)